MLEKLSGWRARLPCISEHRHNLSAYLDGELDLRRRASLEKHLAACMRCRARSEQLRLASRAMSHFVVPPARVPAWQFAERPARPGSSPIASLRRFWTMKLSVPAPVAATASLALVCAAAVLFTTYLNQSRMSVEPLPTSALVPQTKIIEVPVERERIVTRTIYAVRGARPVGASQPDWTANKPQRAPLMAEGATREQDATAGNKELMTAASLAGFRPAADANLRIVKEPEQ
jgi:anti-sigma factor RsiW